MIGAADSPGGGAGALAANIALFGRLLRAAGLPIGAGKAVDAVRAVAATSVSRRDDVYWALHSVFVRRRDDHTLFVRAFAHFWHAPQPPERSGLPTDATRGPQPATDADARGIAPAAESAELGGTLEPGGRAPGDDAGSAERICNIGIIYAWLGDYAKALSTYEQALAQKVALGDKASAPQTLGQIGTVHLRLGD